jgi:phosphoribosylaminoimidazolecarboxamide formyltransferase/IMP cyclohydrolase
VLNLYPFEKVSANPDSSMDDIVENIDIGGRRMLRSAAKNFARVAVATDPAQYRPPRRRAERRTMARSRRRRASRSRSPPSTASPSTTRASATTLSAIGDDGARALFPAQQNSNFVKVMDLRYGENPHQHGAFYRDLWPVPGYAATFTQLQGKELSYNNLADADAGVGMRAPVREAACVIVKHANPCGVAEGTGCGDTYEAAYATDPTSAFGGIIAFNKPLDAATAKTILDRQFVEVLIAPGFRAGRARLREEEGQRPRPAHPARRRQQQHGREARRLGPADADADIREVDARRTQGGHQARADRSADGRPAVRLARRQVREVQRHRLRQDQRTVGVGAGQMSRVVSAKIAALKAEEAGWKSPGSVMASDAFFPFRDGIDAAAAAASRR